MTTPSLASYEAKLRHLRSYIEEQRLRILVLESKLVDQPSDPLPMGTWRSEDDALLDQQLAVYATEFGLLIEHQDQIEAENLAARQADERRWLAGLFRLLEYRYPFLKPQLARTKRWARNLATQLGWQSARVAELETAVELADLGMLSLPDGLFVDTKPLGDQAREAILRHPIVSCELVACTTVGQANLGAIRHHHERFDGKGYPDRLAGSAIPLEARILMLAGAYTAMTAHRAFRPAMTETAARQNLLAVRGTAFDPELTDLFVRLLDQQNQY